MAEHKHTEYTSDIVILDGTYACNGHLPGHSHEQTWTIINYFKTLTEWHCVYEVGKQQAMEIICQIVSSNPKEHIIHVSTMFLENLCF